MSATSPQGIQILEVPNVTASQVYAGETVHLAVASKLRVLLVTIDLSPPGTFPDEKAAEHATDLWLVLAIGEDHSIPVPATQSIKPVREASGSSTYVFPSTELEGAAIQVSLPTQTPQDIRKRFEQILSQYAAFQDDDRSDLGTVELMDQDGRVLGVIQGNYTVAEDNQLKQPGNEKTPVYIDLPEKAAGPTDPSQQIHVGLVPKGEAREKGDWMLKSADFLSRNIVRGSEFISNKMNSAATSYTSKSPAAGSRAGSGATTPTTEGGAVPAVPGEKAPREPVRINPTTTKSLSTVQNLSGQAVQISAKTTGAILSVAANLGDKIGQKTGIQRKQNPDGTLGPAPTGIRGFINRSLIAANTVMDGIDAGAQNLLYSTGDAASKVVGHKYGEEARTASESVVRTGRNVFLVYKDLRGVRRSAILKVVGGRVVRAKMEDGTDVLINVDEKGALIVPDQQKSPVATAASPAQDIRRGSTPTLAPAAISSGSLPPPPAHPSRNNSFGKEKE